jgi:hypothetical protein
LPSKPTALYSNAHKEVPVRTHLLLAIALLLLAACSSNGGTDAVPQGDVLPDAPPDTATAPDLGADLPSAPDLPGETDAAVDAVAPAEDPRLASIPEDALKVTPDLDPYAPVLHSDEFEPPVPVPGPLNTAGAEDAPFISADGSELFFFFTPVGPAPAETQVGDGYTGIWVSRWDGQEWGIASRVVLQGPGDLALDGCPALDGDTLWFCSARAGNFRGVDMWTATRDGEGWTGWQNAGERLNAELQVGELHPLGGSTILYYDAPAGEGLEKDIWRTELVDGAWTDGIQVAELNAPEADIRPFVTADGLEMWTSRIEGIGGSLYRSRKEGDGWSEPERIISSFAAEPTLDPQGNLYFVHHFVVDGEYVEADIYVARKK